MKTLQNIVRHAGDCSCYQLYSAICDCGALRNAILNTVLKDDDLWELWALHLVAVSKGNDAILNDNYRFEHQQEK